MTLVPERFIWATDVLAVEPDFNILEIGCGAGIFADCIADKLTSGNILGIDRSAAMIAKAVKRNQHHIDTGKASFKIADFKSLTPSHSFDSVVAFNVNFFWKASAPETNLIRKSLKKDGRLYVFHQAP